MPSTWPGSVCGRAAPGRAATAGVEVVSVGPVDQLGQAPVDDHLAVVAEHDVVRLEVAVDESIPLHAGSCFHLPPEQVHCIENTGPGVMRILGVFHPSGDPASRAYEDDSQLIPAS